MNERMLQFYKIILINHCHRCLVEYNGLKVM